MLLRIYLICLLSTISSYTEDLKIYIDADFTNYIESSHSIEMGIRTALEENKELLGSTKIKIVKLDHRANSLRSLKNIKTFINDPNRLAIFSGIHSPPLLANRDFINKNKALFLIPWAAASPITRPEKGENWIFRLSVDDSKAGSFLVDQLTKAKYSKPFLLLEKTGWGKHNAKTINSALTKKNIQRSGQEFFNWGPTTTNVRIKVRKILNSGADSILFVGNAREGQIFAKTMHELGVEIPVISHWGIAGGNFYQNLGNTILKKQQWCFIQTSFSFASNKLNPYQQKVLNTAKKLFPKKVDGMHIDAPTGFIHAYDLTSILLHAWLKSGKAKPVNFSALHKSLENMNTPIEGLTKTYKQPFSKYTKENSDAHEALGSEDLRLAIFDDQGNIILK